MISPTNKFFPLSFTFSATLLQDSFAFPSYRYQIPNGFRIACPPNHETSGVSHCTPNDPDIVALGLGAPFLCDAVGHSKCDGPVNHGNTALNLFGADLKTAGFKWTKELCEKDSDGDGLTNGEELGNRGVWSVLFCVLDDDRF